MAAVPDAGEWDGTPLAGGATQPCLDGLTGYLRHRHTSTASLSFETRCDVFGKAYGGAPHTCILAYAHAPSQPRPLMRG